MKRTLAKAKAMENAMPTVMATNMAFPASGIASLSASPRPRVMPAAAKVTATKKALIARKDDKDIKSVYRSLRPVNTVSAPEPLGRPKPFALYLLLAVVGGGRPFGPTL